jgi:hypothetical protein
VLSLYLAKSLASFASATSLSNFMLAHRRMSATRREISRIQFLLEEKAQRQPWQ